MKYWMPNKKTGNPVEWNSDCNSVIIIGGNGSGKSKLGAWIERRDYSVTHRIAAQRSLVFDPNADLMAYDKAENIVISGYHESRDDRNHKWDWNRRNTTRLINDFDASFAAIIVKKNDQLDDFNEKYKKAEEEGLDRPASPWTQIDALRDIWGRIFPQRKLLFKSSRFYAVNPGAPEDEKYSALEMSDGERGVLYLAAQILSLDHGRIVIVDEPETHLHGSIMNNLWTALEAARPDCQFVYITHDINFATRHTNSDKYWIKSFDGKLWDYEKIESNDLPQDLLLEILGSRQNVLFVEGTKDSLDTRLYSILFPGFNVIPCGSCETVVERTKAFSGCPTLAPWCKVKGLLDRDYRSEHEIAANKQDGIFTLGVAEVENLFLVESLLKRMIRHMGMKGADADNTLQRIKDYIIRDRYIAQFEQQHSNALVASLKYYMSVVDVTQVTIGTELGAAIEEFSVFDKAKAEIEARYVTPDATMDYDKVLSIFNEKGLSKSVGQYMGIINKKYQDMVIGVLSELPLGEVRALFEKYIPFNELEA